MRATLFSLLVFLYASAVSAQGFALPSGARKPRPVAAALSDDAAKDSGEKIEDVKENFVKPPTVKMPAVQNPTAREDTLSGNVKQTESFSVPAQKKAVSDPVTPVETPSEPAMQTAAPPAVNARMNAAAVNDNLSPVENWLSVKGRELLTTMSLSNSPSKKAALIALAEDVFRERELARMAVGRYWNQMNEEQQDTYVSLFVPYFVASYGSIPLPVNGVSFRMGGVTPSGKDLLVKTEVDLGDGADEAFESVKGEETAFPKPEGSVMEVYFAVREKEGNFYIRDVNVMGKSMVMVLRGMVERMFKSNNSDPNAFLNAMQAKIDREDKRLQMLAQFGGAQ